MGIRKDSYVGLGDCMVDGFRSSQLLPGRQLLYDPFLQGVRSSPSHASSSNLRRPLGVRFLELNPSRVKHNTFLSWKTNHVARCRACLLYDSS